MRYRYFLSALLVSFMITVSCVSGPGTSGGSGRDPLYHGEGSGATAVGAMNQAKIAILETVAADLLGRAWVSANRDALDEYFYGAPDPSVFLYSRSVEVIAQGKEGSSYRYRIRARVDLDAVESVFRANDIYGSLIYPGNPGEAVLPDQEQPRGFTADSSQPVPGGEREQPAASAAATTAETAETAAVPPEDRAFIEAYIDEMTFMVYFDEDAAEDPFLMKAAAGIANVYLTENALYSVDPERIAEIKKDQERAYEERTGESYTLIQWIARRLNADVYAEIDAVTEGETADGRHYGKANVTMKFFDSSTGQLLSSKNYSSPRTFSTSSRTDAMNNALQSSIYAIMPLALEEVRGYMEKALVKGIKYDMIIQKTPDSRLMRDFARQLERKVRSIRTVSQSEEETVYAVYLLGSMEDLMDIVYDVADGLTGLRSLDLVYFRGKSITFDSGM